MKFISTLQVALFTCLLATACKPRTTTDLSSEQSQKTPVYWLDGSIIYRGMWDSREPKTAESVFHDMQWVDASAYITLSKSIESMRQDYQKQLEDWDAVLRDEKDDQELLDRAKHGKNVVTKRLEEIATKLEEHGATLKIFNEKKYVDHSELHPDILRLFESAFKSDGVSAGRAHTCVVVEGGRLKCFGDGEFGHLGYGDTKNRADEQNELNDFVPIKEQVLQVSAGWRHTCVVLVGGKLKCFGEGKDGQLGYGDTNSIGDEPGELNDFVPIKEQVLQVSAGGAHTCVVLAGGKLKCFGYGLNGQLGYGDIYSRGDEPGELNDFVPIKEQVLQVSAGGTHTCVVLAGGRLKCFGNGEYGRLGYGDTNSRGNEPYELNNFVPIKEQVLKVSSGGFHTCVLLAGGKLKCFGLGDNGRLGYGDNKRRGDEPGDLNDFVPIKEQVLQITVGDSHTCVVLAGGKLKCFGGGGYGQLGYGDTESRGDEPNELDDFVPIIEQILQVSAGFIHTSVIVEGGNLKCFGYGEDGRLGYGDRQNRGDKPDSLNGFVPLGDKVQIP